MWNEITFCQAKLSLSYAHNELWEAFIFVLFHIFPQQAFLRCKSSSFCFHNRDAVACLHSTLQVHSPVFSSCTHRGDQTVYLMPWTCVSDCYHRRTWHEGSIPYLRECLFFAEGFLQDFLPKTTMSKSERCKDEWVYVLQANLLFSLQCVKFLSAPEISEHFPTFCSSIFQWFWPSIRKCRRFLEISWPFDYDSPMHFPPDHKKHLNVSGGTLSVSSRHIDLLPVRGVLVCVAGYHATQR